MDGIAHLMAALPFGIYACAALAPFVQEDAAVVGAAAASSTGLGDPFGMFAAVLIGLTLSDVWKYWLGRAASAHSWGERFARRPAVRRARDSVLNRLGITLLVVRFVPFTRIPTYIASGLFGAPFGRFAAYVAMSAAAYIAVAFGLFQILGIVVGKQLQSVAPVLVLGLVGILVVGNWLRSRAKPAE